MRSLLNLRESRPKSSRRGIAAALAVMCVALVSASSASAAAEKINKTDFAKFVNCPIESATFCQYGETTSGEIKLGSGKAVPITNPSILQGGLAFPARHPLPVIPPRFGAEELQRSPQTVPGGLTGLSELIGGEVKATAEQAGTIEVNGAALGEGENSTAVLLPIRVHLENEMLGPNCYVGSEADPILLHLTTGTTSPPAGTEPISGSKGEQPGKDKGKLLTFLGTSLVDNTFAVPAATGCGTNALLEPVITAAVNTAEGLPAEPGKSYAILNGNNYATSSTWVLKYDKKLLKEKEHPKAAK
jgi:hypothetical protein